ncbi:MAG: hypothetical protein JWP66_1042 [Naasia sp.]|nr:hypothetical protein [Naasia sp.]
MPVYRLTAPGQQPELLEADYVRDEGLTLSLRGTAWAGRGTPSSGASTATS